MDTKVKISFLKLFNAKKGIGQPQPSDDVEQDWLAKRAPKHIRENWQGYLDHYEKVGVTHQKVQYPVLFGQGDNQYPGMLAVEDIAKNETIIKVPSREIINTKKAFYSELEEMFYEHPELFSKTLSDGEDMILHAFILFEI